MDTIFQWGLDFIIMIQQINTPLLDSFFRAITSLGDESFYLLLFPFELLPHLEMNHFTCFYFPSLSGVLIFIWVYGLELSFYYPFMLIPD
jgi:hypothetical protein